MMLPPLQNHIWLLCSYSSTYSHCCSVWGGHSTLGGHTAERKESGGGLGCVPTTGCTFPSSNTLLKFSFLTELLTQTVVVFHTPWLDSTGVESDSQKVLSGSCSNPTLEQSEGQQLHTEHSGQPSFTSKTVVL